jgi:hypothetical protein
MMSSKIPKLSQKKNILLARFPREESLVSLQIFFQSFILSLRNARILINNPFL